MSPSRTGGSQSTTCTGTAEEVEEGITKTNDTIRGKLITDIEY